MARKKIKVPKKVAGVKIPRMLRKSSFLKALLNNPLGREVVAKALIAGAGAAATVLLAKREDVQDAAGAVVHEAGSAAGTAKHALSSAASAMADVVSEAAHGLLPTKSPKKSGKRDKDAEASDPDYRPSRH